ncbi:MAG: hypothetical protein MZW92_74195 [Comamonadaceae bacterium]|nr:hypothetical protein [Comamonadaceae bacterium]
MISRALQAEILRLHHSEDWPIGTIARQLRVHHEHGAPGARPGGRAAHPRPLRASMVEPYRPFIAETLAKYPTLRASRLYAMVRERGYPGGPDHFRAHRGAAAPAARRPRPTCGCAPCRASRRRSTGRTSGTSPIGRAARPLMAFVMVLSYSRQHVPALLPRRARWTSFLRGHVEAFAVVRRACPRVLLYDNLKSAVLERAGRCDPLPPAAAGAGRALPLRAAPGGPRREATRRAGWSGQSAISAMPSSPGAASAIWTISMPRRAPGAQAEAADAACARKIAA